MSTTSHSRLQSLFMVLALSVGAFASNALAQDSDGDGIPDSKDNCPTMAIPIRTTAISTASVMRAKLLSIATLATWAHSAVE